MKPILEVAIWTAIFAGPFLLLVLLQARSRAPIHRSSAPWRAIRYGAIVALLVGLALLPLLRTQISGFIRNQGNPELESIEKSIPLGLFGCAMWLWLITATSFAVASTTIFLAIRIVRAVGSRDGKPEDT